MLTPVTSAITSRTCTRSYPGAAEYISDVRADLRALVTDCPHADDILLCASELAANAALHSRSAEPGGTITVRTEICPGQHVRIEVYDGGGRWAEPVIDADRPHGLDIVTVLASGWGTIPTASGRIVWARFDWPAA
jgi:serine/threonine-protein kinase RsbW